MQFVCPQNLKLVSAGSVSVASDDFQLSPADFKDEPPNYLIAIGAFCVIYGLLEKYSPDLK